MKTFETVIVCCVILCAAQAAAAVLYLAMIVLVIYGLLFRTPEAVGLLALWGVFALLDSHPLPTLVIGGGLMLIGVVRSGPQKTRPKD